jgi:chromosome partitioning protein
MRTIALTNQKGGVAKTTTAVNLAAALAEQGKTVLLIDLDPQGSATRWLGADPGGRGLYDLLSGGGSLDGLVQPTKTPDLELVPASRALGRADRDLAGEPGVDLVLKRALEAARPHDFVLIDCPPQLGILVAIALATCQQVLVPVATHVMELHGLADLTATIDKVRERLNPELEVMVLACRVDRRTRLAGDVVDALRRRFPAELLETVIHENVRLAEAPSHHEPIILSDPYSTGAADYRELAHELLKGRL